MPVADTSFLVDILRRKPAAVALYTSYEKQDLALSTTAVTALELYKGAHLPARSEKNVEKVRELLSLFEVLPFDRCVCEVFGPLSAELQKKGISIGDFDEVIAATVLCHDGILITRDDHFSQVPGIEVVGY